MPKRRIEPNQNLTVAYIRVSTDTTRQELGAERQRKDIETFARAHDLAIAAVFVDETSGGAALEDRPGLLGALQAVKEHGAGSILVQKRDRFTRDKLETASIELDLRKIGARILAADGLGNGEDAASRLMATVLEASAEFERATIRARIKAALKVKSERGQRVGSVTYGFQLDADGKTLVPNPVEAAVVARARELRGSGLTLKAVSATLAAEGLANRKGKAFDLGTLHRMTAA